MSDIAIISFVLSGILSYIGLPMIRGMLFDSNVVCENFRSQSIPNAMGLLFIFVQVITIGILQIIYNFTNDFNLIYLLGFGFIGIIGLLDDLIGEKKIKGLRGHIKAFFRGTLTTGAIKAFLGLFISLVVSSYISFDIINFIVNALVIALFTNCINLFDLRPGRAAKVFIIVSAVFIITGFARDINYIIFSMYGLLIPYMILDLKAEIMMGDTGANVLGFTLGIYAAIGFQLMPKVIILSILVIIHYLAEKVSFSKIIENNRILKYLDDMGRGKELD